MSFMDPSDNWSGERPRKRFVWQKDKKQAKSTARPRRVKRQDPAEMKAPAPVMLPAAPHRPLDTNKPLKPLSDQELQEIMEELQTVNHPQAKMIYRITAFLFVVFFPLGLVLHIYNRMFGPSLRVSIAVFSMWWLNFSVIWFLLS